MGSLVRAIEQMSSVDLGAYAIVGGVAVAARLGQAQYVDASCALTQGR